MFGMAIEIWVIVGLMVLALLLLMACLRTCIARRDRTKHLLSTGFAVLA